MTNKRSAAHAEQAPTNLYIVPDVYADQGAFRVPLCPRDYRVREKRTVFLTERDVASCGGIISILCDNSYLVDFGREARKLAEKKFNLDRFSERINREVQILSA